MKNIETLLQKLTENDNGEPLDDFDFEMLIFDIKDEIDTIYEFISRCSSEKERLKKDYIDKIMKRQKVIDKSVLNLKNWVIKNMIENKMPKLKGDLFELKLIDRESLDLAEFEIDSSFYLQNQDICIRKYEIDKSKLTAKIKQGREYAFANMKKAPYLKFSVVKPEKPVSEKPKRTRKARQND